MPNLPQTSSTCAPIVLHMHKKFEVNRTKIKGGCQSYTKAAPKESWNNLTLDTSKIKIGMKYTIGGSWGKFFMSDWSLTGPFWSLIAPESCSKVSLSIFYCRKVLQPIKDLCYKISLSDNIFMISKLDPAMFFFILLDSSKIKTSKKLILLTQLSVAWKWSLS